MTTQPTAPTPLAEPRTGSTLSASEMFDDLGGLEEIAIARLFDASINTLASSSQTQFVRALIFIDQRRAGINDREAYRIAQDMKLGQVKTYFGGDATTEVELGSDEGKDA